MAEIAGLILRATALAGIFTNYISLISYISAYRSIKDDYEVLDTKLDVEKTLFLQWVERVQLLQPDYNRRLDDPGTCQTIIKVLTSLRSVLRGTSVL
jgi:hypothetical protein